MAAHAARWQLQQAVLQRQEQRPASWLRDATIAWLHQRFGHIDQAIQRWTQLHQQWPNSPVPPAYLMLLQPDSEPPVTMSPAVAALTLRQLAQADWYTELEESHLLQWAQQVLPQVRQLSAALPASGKRAARDVFAQWRRGIDLPRASYDQRLYHPEAAEQDWYETDVSLMRDLCAIVMSAPSSGTCLAHGLSHRFRGGTGRTRRWGLADGM